jgi:DNA-binding transcriptional LysR family regulator
MDQRQVEIFLAVMRIGSVTAAADSLTMTQPAVSKSIAQMERVLGFKLFERTRGRLIPTNEAAMVFEQALHLYEETERFGRFLENVRHYRAGQLRLAATPALALALAPIAVAQFRKDFPHYGLALDMQLNHEVPEAVGRRQYDLGLLVIPTTDEGPRYRMLMRGKMVCVMSRGHPLAALQEVNWNDILPHELIYITTDMRLVSLLRESIPEFSQRPGSALETNRYSIAINLVAQGLGVTLVDEFTLMGVEHDNLLVRPFVPEIAVSLVAAITSDRSPKRSALDFLNVFRNVLKQNALYPESPDAS